MVCKPPFRLKRSVSGDVEGCTVRFCTTLWRLEAVRAEGGGQKYWQAQMSAASAKRWFCCSSFAGAVLSLYANMHHIVHGFPTTPAFSKALSPYGDVLLAYEMNGELLPPEHGGECLVYSTSKRDQHQERERVVENAQVRSEGEHCANRPHCLCLCLRSVYVSHFLFSSSFLLLLSLCALYVAASLLMRACTRCRWRHRFVGPVRIIVPGHVGIRNIKWVGSVTTSDEEAEGYWQRGAAYKGFAPGITSFEGQRIDVCV